MFKNDSNYRLAAAGITETNNFIYPIKTYKTLESDSMGTITNVLSKMSEDSSAAIQLVIRPTDNKWRKSCEKAASDIQGGGSGPGGGGSAAKQIVKGTGELVKDLGKAAAAKDTSQESNSPQEPKKLTPMQEQTLQSLEQKASKIGFETQIRVVTCARSKEEADSHLENITSSFAQFNAPELNSLKKAKAKEDQIINQFLELFHQINAKQ